MLEIRQWQLHWVSLDPVMGSEQKGKRPALVISSDAVHGTLPLCTVLPVTSRKQNRRIYPVEALLPAAACGLPVDSIVMTHQIRTIAKERFCGSCGEIRDESLKESVRIALRKHLTL